jgi:eukaryotic-like serine/threonine-protein kinase
VTALCRGDRIRLTPAGVAGMVGTKLGEGGQGEVHELLLTGGRPPLALKWYGNGAPPGHADALRALVDRGPPTASFLWPLEMAESDERPGFGYVMPIRPPEYVGLLALMRRQVVPDFRTLLTTGIQLAIGFHELHSAGLCYRDISFGNVFFEPAGGSVLICDNDNVGIDGRTIDSIEGTPRFKAPEIVRGEALPSIATDRYSLAVLLFYLLHVHHPLHGRREFEHPIWDDQADYAMFGAEPLFVFDPDDDRNAPQPGEHDQVLLYWSLYPQFLRRLFTRAFTVGLHDPMQRVGESEWRDALLRLRDLVVVCEACDGELFMDPDDGSIPPCWQCGRELEAPFRLRCGRREVVLSVGAVVRPFHVDPQRRRVYDGVVGAVNRHPTDGRIGQRNETDGTWVASMPGGSEQRLPPGRTVGFRDGLLIRFPGSEGEVVR